MKYSGKNATLDDSKRVLRKLKRKRNKGLHKLVRVKKRKMGQEETWMNESGIKNIILQNVDRILDNKQLSMRIKLIRREEKSQRRLRKSAVRNLNEMPSTPHNTSQYLISNFKKTRQDMDIAMRIQQSEWSEYCEDGLAKLKLDELFHSDDLCVTGGTMKGIINSQYRELFRIEPDEDQCMMQTTEAEDETYEDVQNENENYYVVYDCHHLSVSNSVSLSEYSVANVNNLTVKNELSNEQEKLGESATRCVSSEEDIDMPAFDKTP
jgi:hypothetical protein